MRLHARELLRDGFLGLIVEEPPRHGKSELCTHYDTVYYLGSHPDDRVIIVSYESEFAASWGRKARNTMEALGPALYGINVDPRSSAADRWDIQGHKGGVITAGARGAITGRGGEYVKVDDPVKGAEEAQSETIRNKIWENWQQTIRTRVEPNGVVLVIGTRWHEDDLIGRLLASMGEGIEGKRSPYYDPDADKYVRIRLPAICEPPSEEFPDPDPLGRAEGEVLWPERWPYQRLRPHMVNAYKWAALFQQRPAPLEGGMFKQDWMEVVPHPGGKFKKIVRWWDLAATDPKAGEDPDFTVGLKLGLHANGLYYVLDVERFRESPGKLEAHLKRTGQRDEPVVRIRLEQEPGSSGKIAARHILRTCFPGRPARSIRLTGDKILRAETVAAACEREEIKVVRADWNREFFYEVTRFPNASHDDQVDALSGAYTELAVKKGGVKYY